MAIESIMAIEKLKAEEEIQNKVVQSVQGVPTPFSQFLDTAVSALNDLSAMEAQTTQMTADYMKGAVSMEEVMFQTNRLSMAMQLAVSVVNTSVQTFKELQQMQV